jgi:Uma2 family endonuclease
MVTAQAQSTLYTPQEYLALEREAEFKSEYLDGIIYAMSGGSPQHSAIAANVIAITVAALRGKPCQVFSSDLKVATDPNGLYAYPDLSIVCGELSFQDEQHDVITNPTVLVEVLSPSTEAYDRGRKFAHYQHLESLKDYVLIAQDEPQVDHFTRQEGSQWIYSSATGLEANIFIASIDCVLHLSEVYDKVQFVEPQTPAS